MVMVAIPVILLDNGKSKYFRWGPHEDFIMVSVPINTNQRYICTIIFAALLSAGEVVIGEIANPILGFNIYNPDKKVITEFTKNELQFYGNMFYLLCGLRYIFKVSAMVAQIDIAFFSVLAGELASLYTIRMLLDEKTYEKKKKKEKDNVGYSKVEPCEV